MVFQGCHEGLLAMATCPELADFFLSWFLRLPCSQYQPTLQFMITIVPTLFKCWNCWINKGLILHSVPHPNATQIVHSVVSGSLQPHGLQHTRFLCTSLSPRVCSASCPLNRWRHPTICCSFLLPSIFPSIRVFSSESAVRIRWAKY